MSRKSKIEIVLEDVFAKSRFLKQVLEALDYSIDEIVKKGIIECSEDIDLESRARCDMFMYEPSEKSSNFYLRILTDVEKGKVTYWEIQYEVITENVIITLEETKCKGKINYREKIQQDSLLTRTFTIIEPEPENKVDELLKAIIIKSKTSSKIES